MNTHAAAHIAQTTFFDRMPDTEPDKRRIYMTEVMTMNPAANVKIDENALKYAVVEIKLFVNRRLFEKNAITEEMYMRAKELIVQEGPYISATYPSFSR